MCFPALAGLFLLGLFYGAVSEKSGFSAYYISAVIRIYKNSSFFELSCYLFLSQLMLNAVLLFACVSCVGAPIVAVVPICSGYVNGCVFGYMTSVSGVKGAVGYFVMIWLPVFLQTLCMLYFAAESLSASVGLFKHHFMNAAATQNVKIKGCIYVFFAVCIAEFMLSLLFGGFIKLFGPVFL